MSAQPLTREHMIEGFRVLSTELDFCSAADLVPELVAVVAPGFDIQGQTDASVGKAIAAMSTSLVGGKLRALLPRLLAGMQVVIPDEQRYELSTEKGINGAFKGRKKLGMACVKQALEDNFRDFFDGADLSALGIRTP